jgi:hypothetical protein
MHDLVHLVQHVQKIEDPRVALIITDDGEIHFATSIHPREAAQALEEMAATYPPVRVELCARPLRPGPGRTVELRP